MVSQVLSFDNIKAKFSYVFNKFGGKFLGVFEI